MSKGYILTPSGQMPVKQLYTLTGGKVLPVDKAYALIGGTVLLWYQRGTPLGSLAVGSTVKIAVDGTDYDWLVVHQGIPDASIYDTSCAGTWLLMLDIYEMRKWNDSGGQKNYANSSVHTYLNGAFLGLLESNVKNAIKQVKIPYCTSGLAIETGANGLLAKVFLPALREVGVDKVNYWDEGLADGAKLGFFTKGNEDGKGKRIAMKDGAAAQWWLRTPYRSIHPNGVYLTKADGTVAGPGDSNSTCGVRPCMILPPSTLVDDTGHIVEHDPRTPLGWLGVGSTVKMDVNGNKRIWRIAYKGNPNPDIYDSSCDGVWLVLNTIYSTRANGNDCQYAGGTIDTYLNSTFLERIDKTGNAAKYIKDIKIPYAKKLGDGSWKVQTKENGLPCKVFLPSVFEIGGSENASVYKDGSVLGYYDGSPSTLTLKLSGTPAAWRTRTVTSDAQSEFSIDANGTITTCSPTDVIGVVPCVIMNPDALVEDGIIVGE